MGMFLNYKDIASNYIPNNLVSSFPTGKSYTKLDPIKTSKPYEEYNTKGELVGYFWRYGETLNLEFNLDGEIVVEHDAIILLAKGETPSEDTGTINQRAYNVVDKISWTCTGSVEDKRVWTQDTEFRYPEQGTSVYISANDYLKDKQIELTLYNFRMEPVHTQLFTGKPKVIFPITTELSKKLLRGIYYCSLKVFNDAVNINVFDTADCMLLVK